MEEKFYISNSYKFIVSALLSLMSYKPILDMLNNEVGLSLIILLILWVVHVYSWIKPAVILTATELLINWIGYGKKRILLSDIKAVEIKGRNNLYISFVNNGIIKSQVISSSVVDNTERLVELLNSKIPSTAS